MFAAVAALAAIFVVVLVLVLAGGSPYTVKADFVTASQLVKGNAVKVSGHTIGSVGDISLTGDGKARVTLEVTGEGYHPLRRGTRATIRQTSLSGVANRYVDLQLGGAGGKDIADGGTLPTENTSAAVDLDQIFDTFDPEARRGVQKSVEFLRDFQAGNEDEANAALRYLNPALSGSARLFRELDRSTPDFQRFIVETARLVTDVSAQDGVLADLTRNLARTTTALTSNGEALGESIGLLPNVMRKANTTFVNLRSALDDLDPLVNDAKPVVRTKLIPFLDELRPFARDARPAVRELSQTVRRPGADNDLVELLRRQPALDKIANQSAERNGKDRPGALPTTIKAFEGVTKQLAFLRPYAPDLVGWFDDFSTTGAYDALGNFSRAGLQLNGFTLGPALNALPIPAELRTLILAAGTHPGR
ncbi:MAG: phospholipid/cholesterol/gamma-HCH transport system substrate-binding protein, partial [Solirubrobacteraceae bacterium]|nr:phospholipid/cholesterol/gamma-HCH transport system substrate-binding protein [Solirubrobacteraceae bacterium]